MSALDTFAPSPSPAHSYRNILTPPGPTPVFAAIPEQVQWLGLPPPLAANHVCRAAGARFHTHVRRNVPFAGLNGRRPKRSQPRFG
jgi:hypothetical protein